MIQREMNLYQPLKWFGTQLNTNFACINAGSPHSHELNRNGKSTSLEIIAQLHTLHDLNFKAQPHITFVVAIYRLVRQNSGFFSVWFSFHFYNNDLYFKRSFCAWLCVYFFPFSDISFYLYISIVFFLPLSFAFAFVFISFSHSLYVRSFSSFSLSLVVCAMLSQQLLVYTFVCTFEYFVRACMCVCYRFPTLEILNEVLCNCEKWSDKKWEVSASAGRTYSYTLHATKTFYLKQFTWNLWLELAWVSTRLYIPKTRAHTYTHTHCTHLVAVIIAFYTCQTYNIFIFLHSQTESKKQLQMS